MCVCVYAACRPVCLSEIWQLWHTLEADMHTTRRALMHACHQSLATPRRHTRARGANFDLINEITLRPSPAASRPEGREEGRTD